MRKSPGVRGVREEAEETTISLASRISLSEAPGFVSWGEFLRCHLMSAGPGPLAGILQGRAVLNWAGLGRSGPGWEWGQGMEVPRCKARPLSGWRPREDQYRLGVPGTQLRLEEELLG